MSQIHKHRLTQTPDLTSLIEKHPDLFPALFNSNIINEKTGRFSILFAQSEMPVTAYETEELQELLIKFDQKIGSQHCTDLPFYSGWLIYLSYACIKAWEPSLEHIKHDGKQPLAIAIRSRSAIIIDHMQSESWVVADSQAGVDCLLHVLSSHDPQSNKHGTAKGLNVLNDDLETYVHNVNLIKDYIKSGDVYQVNLARQWRLNSGAEVDVFDIYRTLSNNNPAPFAGLFQIPNFAVISSSPERLVKVNKGVIETRPIAGTRPRNKDPELDKKMIDELINHPKEQAEHVMLLDLERNDLGRVSRIGSVKVDEFMAIESYSKVHHIVSNVCGKLADEMTFLDVIKATFPGGTITGCPKIRCMQIIDELEQKPRGAYTGSMGYITDDGQMDLNILIRTITVVEEDLVFHAGAGVVYDSIAEKEAQESFFKAQALINSLQN